MQAWTVSAFAALNHDAKRRVGDLREACERAEPLDLKLEIDETDPTGEPIHFLAEADGELVGYAGLTPGDEAEACGMVLPAWRRRGVATELLNHVLGAGRRLARDSVLVICEDSSPMAAAWMRRIGATDDSAEQRMTVRLDGAPRDASRRGTAAPLELRRPEAADTTAVIRLIGDGFSERADQVAERLVTATPDELLVALDAGAVVGTLRLTTTPRRSMIYGFVIDPQRRGERLGTRMLAAVFELLRGRGVAEVGLEVDPENTPAVRLYTAFGFTTVTTYRYLRLASSLVSS
jgi:mycothiol synthase